VYSAGVFLNVRLLPSAATDHRPIVASLCSGSGRNSNRVIDRRNFKAIDSGKLCAALEECCVLEDVYAIKNVDESLAFIMGGISAALDKVAPVKTITVKDSSPLYLSEETCAAV
jgi:hypothetical protein